MRRIRARLTYANVTATLALFVALGGTSYAIGGAPLARSSATASCCTVSGSVAYLKLDSVRTGNIVNGQVTTADIGTGQVISSDVRDGTIGVQDLSAAVQARLRPAPKTPNKTKNHNKDTSGSDQSGSGGGAGTTTTPGTTP